MASNHKSVLHASAMALVFAVIVGCAAPGRVAVAPEPAAETLAASQEKAETRQPSVRPVAHLAEPDPLPEPAEQPMPAERLDSLDALIDHAKTNNPQIAAARAKADALMWRVPQVQSLPDPQLTTTAFLHSIETAAGPQDVALSLQQEFPWFGKRALRGNIAYHDTQAAYEQLAAVELSVVEQVKLAYYELYFLARALKVNRSLQSRLEDVITVARTKYETDSKKVGLESVLQAEVTLAKLKTAIVELEQAQQKAKARLAQALHLPAETSFDVAETLESSNVPKQVDSLLAMIEQCRPDLEARRNENARDEAAACLAQRNYYPDVTVGFNWHAIGPDGLSPVTTGDDAYSLMVGVNLPIYRSRLDAALFETQHQTAQSVRQYEATWDAAYADVRKLHAQAVEQDRILQILRETILPKAKQTFDLSMEAFRLDRIGFQQLIDNYEGLLRYEIELHLRTARREQAVASLERAVGCAVATWPTEPE